MSPAPPPPIETIRRLFEAHGMDLYGEDVTQQQHALQCAALAEGDGASDAMIVAALLHDIGHFLHRDAAAALTAGIDDKHERIGAAALAEWFGARMAEPAARLRGSSLVPPAP